MNLRPIWSLSSDGDRGIPRPTTPRNAWCAWQVVVTAGGQEAGEIRLELDRPALTGGGRLDEAFCHRVWAVPHEGQRVPEILVPVEWGRDAMPQRRPAGPRPTGRFVVEFFIPADADPGTYEGALTIQAGDEAVEVPVAIEVAPVTLPDEFHIAGDMNTYGAPAKSMNVSRRSPAAFYRMERIYYALAHAHRMTLNVLPYSQNGSINWRAAPKLAGDGAETHVADWRMWDARYGPLLDGSAFDPDAGYVGPGADTPIRHMYLPLHENWPMPLGEHFTPWPPPEDYQEFLRWSAELPPIEECLDEAYAGGWKNVLRDFLSHVAAKGWTGTRLQVYLNNKYYFRRPRGDGRPGSGTSLWLLDEPMHARDFRALAYFGRLMREARRAWLANRKGRGGRPILDYRIDISRPQHQRSWLDGVVDLNVCADRLRAHRRHIARRKRVFGERYWNYRRPGSFGGSNLGWAAWPVRSYLWGATGTLPWQTIGSDGDLRKADDTALIYPGRKFGIDRPVPSLRMKAWRAGLELAELLRMIREHEGWNELQLREWTGPVGGEAFLQRLRRDAVGELSARR